jgi:hypothetical protein
MKNLQKPSMMLWRIKLFEPVAPVAVVKGCPLMAATPLSIYIVVAPSALPASRK